MKWYYVIEGRCEGPIDEERLRELIASGSLKPGDLVWNETMGTAWKRAAEVFPSVGGVPPPIPPAVPGMRGPSDSGAGGAATPSCTAPLFPAWRRMKTILFQPFRVGKWFVMGFSLWLATLGQFRGTGVPNSIFRMMCRPLRDRQCCVSFDFVPGIHAFVRWKVAPLFLFAAFAVVLGFLVLIVFLWLRSRGKFLFLDNVVNNRAEVSRPWRFFAHHGNSLFLWTLGFNLLFLLLALPLIAVTFFVVTGWLRAGRLRTEFLPIVLGLGVLWLLFGAVRFYVSRFLEDFVVPLMYKFNLTATAAWRRFLGILIPALGCFVLYGIFYILLEVALVAIVLLLVIATCCVAGCVLAIPYVGTVFLLPAFVFLRCYSLEYLARFGEEFRLAGVETMSRTAEEA
ncbi:MAG: DUF4339 domain-containing protein [Kiritimatiellae bacterium]|nr:DUF4339 domain-containing protein [Kiritimatiellia bacterium]